MKAQYTHQVHSCRARNLIGTIVLLNYEDFFLIYSKIYILCQHLIQFLEFTFFTNLTRSVPVLKVWKLHDLL